MSLVLFRIAWRDLRGAFSALRIFLACVLLGVSSIAAVGLVIRAADEGIEQHARSLLGGDLMVRTIYTPISDEARHYIEQHAETAEYISFRTMGALADVPHPVRQLVELKAVPANYPLQGRMQFDPAMTNAEAFGLRDGHYGVAVEPDLLPVLGAKVGDLLKLGRQSFVIRAVIASEPDRLTSSFTLGPRVMISRDALPSTNLVQFGSMLYYRLVMVLPKGADIPAFQQSLQKYDDGGWEISNLAGAAPGLRRAIDRLGLFLGFAAVATLLIGGVGIANATTAYFQSRMLTIARLKCIGATQNQVLLIYLAQVFVMTALATLGGLLLGIALEYLLLALFGAKLPVEAARGVYMRPLVYAALYGFLTVLTFGLPALLKAGRTRPVLLLRDSLSHLLPRRARPSEMLAMLAGLTLLLELTVRFTHHARLSLYFALCVIGALVFFEAIAEIIIRLARYFAKPGRCRSPSWRLALANLSRPGAITRSVMLSMGLGASLMMAIALISLNFHRQLTFDRSADMPAFFLIDIPQSDVEAMRRDLSAIPGVSDIEAQPMLRGRIVAVNGQPLDPAKIDPEYHWVLSNERGISYAAALPKGSTVVAGQWWPENYQGPPLVSLAADIGRGIGVKVGDEVTFGFMGREVIAKVANFREVNWSSLQMNFSILMTPGAFGDLAINELATLKAPDAKHGEVLRLLAERYPSVSVIRLKETLAEVAGMFDSISSIVLGVAAESLVVSLLVIAGALSANLQARRYDTVLLKVLGQTRGAVKAMLWREMLGIIGVTLILSVGVGGLIAELIGRQMMLPRFYWYGGVMLLAPLFALPVSAFLVQLASRRLLSVRPMAMLRNE